VHHAECFVIVGQLTVGGHPITGLNLNNSAASLARSAVPARGQPLMPPASDPGWSLIV